MLLQVQRPNLGATDGRTLTTFLQGLQIRVWWPNGACGNNFSTVLDSPPQTGSNLTFTSGWYYYGSCGAQADNYQTTVEDVSLGNIYTCQTNAYGGSCYVNGGIPLGFSKRVS